MSSRYFSLEKIPEPDRWCGRIVILPDGVQCRIRVPVGPLTGNAETRTPSLLNHREH